MWGVCSCPQQEVLGGAEQTLAASGQGSPGVDAGDTGNRHHCFVLRGPGRRVHWLHAQGGRCWVEMSLGLQPGSLEFSVQLVPVGLCFGPSALSPGSVSSSVRREAVETEPPWLILSTGRMVGLPLGQPWGGTLDLATSPQPTTWEHLRPFD